MGIWQRLFGRDPNEPKESFFLEPDDAKTYGDIDYMRKPQIIKRTFAKTVSGGGGETIQAISAIEKREIGEPEVKPAPRSVASPAAGFWGSTPISKPAPTPAPAPAPAPKAEEKPAPAPAPTSTKSDDLDFRSLARGIKKP